MLSIVSSQKGQKYEDKISIKENTGTKIVGAARLLINVSMES